MKSYNRALKKHARKLRTNMTDAVRDQVLAGMGLRVLRFDNRQVLLKTASVLEMIDGVVLERLKTPPPP